MMYLIFLLSKPVLISISLGRHCPDCTIRRGQEKNNFINTKDKIVMEDNIKRVSYLGADRSCRTGLLVGLGLQACWYCGFESLLWHGSLSPMSTVCCQVEVSATDRSLVQRRPRSTRTVELWEKKKRNWAHERLQFGFQVQSGVVFLPGRNVCLWACAEWLILKLNEIVRWNHN